MPTLNKIPIHNKLKKNVRKTHSNSKFILSSRPWPLESLQFAHN